MLPPSLVLLLWLVVQSAAITVPFTTKTLSVPAIKDSTNGFNLSNVNNAKINVEAYFATLTVAGHEFKVQLDTGTSDLWLDTTGVTLSGVQDLKGTTSVTYDDGTLAQGEITLANVTFGNFTVPQPFISAQGSNASVNGDTGRLGMAAPALSGVANTVGGAPLMQTIFASNPGQQNFTTFQFSRSEATGTTDGGIFSINEINPNFTGVTNSPKLNGISNFWWITFLDGIKVNGVLVNGDSVYSEAGQTANQTLALFDTSSSTSKLPPSYQAAIYAHVKGSVFNSTTGYYTVPCNTNIELSFIFGGVEYPVHPIDTVLAEDNGKGGITCVSGFYQGPHAANEDFVLGANFLRNTYALFNYGESAWGADPPFAPYIQLMSTTDAKTASSEFSSLSSQRQQAITGSASSSDGHSVIPHLSTLSTAFFLLGSVSLCSALY
ncbi:acid protease [Rickenella mellea]|uniref:Acid protease n=1 Tax=Rickenella mellea TaxID=50990 RepID=A0A4Y7PM54_9AGAM|nr:acid protease [Rickenella mellea]